MRGIVVVRRRSEQDQLSQSRKGAKDDAKSFFLAFLCAFAALRVRSLHPLERRADLEVFEAHELLDVAQRDFTRRPVALLADDDLDDALMLAGLVAVGAVQEHDDVGVLFYTTRLP